METRDLILEKLEGINRRYQEISKLITCPEVISDRERFVNLNKEYKDLGSLIESYREYKDVLSNIETAREILISERDEEMRDIAKQELDIYRRRKEELERRIKILLLPADPEDEKDAILEIRAGTGGDEASIFAGDLFRMYCKFCEMRKWKVEVTRRSEGTVGGYKEIVATIKGEKVYGTLKYESGVHRVQRIPRTETQGRIHTSAATVAVLPVPEDFDVVIRDEDIKKETFAASGPGGQHVNRTYSAVRLTHIPTAIVVSCQDEKSQIKNLQKAMKELYTRVYNLEYQKRLQEIARRRKTMVSTGDRSAKIRTYNYPKNRVTDHRINLSIYKLSEILDGHIQEIIEKLQMAENIERLKEHGLV